MERLTHQGEHGPYWDKAVFNKHGGMEEDLIIDRLAYYENLEEQGQLVVLPCKIDAIIYQLKENCECTVGHTHLHNTCHRPTSCYECPAVKIKRWIIETTFSLDMLDRIGKDFFVTLDEAERVLEKKNKK